ncbi:hypothetical protein ABZ805_19460 [Saccharopolyspora sp. NPDC047091]|uniref:hypothetical protein n=1 Tax=Saccharopolyspora sp. NPDC047091 TaxID=3155924 RepID=UPI0033F8C0F9
MSSFQQQPGTTPAASPVDRASPGTRQPCTAALRKVAGAGGGLIARDRRLAGAANAMRGDLPTPDVVGAVEAGRLVAAAESGTVEPEGDDVAFRTAAATGQAAAVVQRQGLAPGARGGADWSGFGSVVPVLAASPGAGASVVAAVLADALQLAGRRVLLVDTADPVRSGLAAAARSDGPVFDGPHPAVRIRSSWRAHAVLARIETSLPIVTPGMVPPPQFFAAAARSVQATIVDIGHDPWRVAAHPLAGAGAWLRVGEPVPRPLLVCRASRPSLLHAEQVLARLESWNRTGTIVPPAQLVVLGARKWPAGVAGAAGRRTSALLQHAVFLPHDSSVALGGITAEVTPARLRDAAIPLLQHLRLLPGPAHSAGKSFSRKVIR